MQKGYNYHDICNERIAEGVPKNRLEKDEEHCVYIGRMHITDYETGIIGRGPCKIGRAVYVNAVQRGRNQSGGDFRIYARIIVINKFYTSQIEKYIAKKYNTKKATGPLDNQTELYNFQDHELEDLWKDIEKQYKPVIIKVKSYI